MMRCTQTLILFLALLLTNCTATSLPAMPGSTTTVTTTLPLAITATPSPTATTPAGGAPTATATMPLTTPVAPAPTPTETLNSTARPAPTWPPSPTPTPTATVVPETPAVTLSTNANLRAGPGTACPVIGGGHTGQVLPVLAQYGGWWQTPRGWVSGTLAQPNTVAAVSGRVPVLASVPAPPTGTPVLPTSTPPPSAPAGAGQPPHQERVVLGPGTQYPVRARVVQGWDYEFSDLSTHYDILVYRDVFGMLAHQIDDENVRRFGRQSRFARYGPLRITLVDAQPHPDPACPGWGWAPDRDTFVDPYGMTQDPCKVEHSLFPQGDGAGTTLLIGWGYNAGTTLAIGTAGPHLGDASTSFLAEVLPWPGNLGPADRPDFSQPLYQPLGAAYKEDGRWAWRDPFAEVVPAGQ